MMNKYNFDKLINRFDGETYKYNVDKDVLPMWVADMDFEVFDKITKAIKARADQNCYGYNVVPEKYFLAYKNYWKRHHNVDFEVDECIFCTGVVAAIGAIFSAFSKQGDRVLLQTPVYHTFFNCINNYHLQAVENHLIYDGKKYSIDYKAFERQIKEDNIKIFLLCNPHNPTGYIYSQEELNNIAKICKQNNVLLISDEIHSEIVSPGYLCHSALEVDEEYLDNVIVLVAGSKCFNIAGLHSSVVVVKNHKMRDQLQTAIYHNDVGEANHFACDANVAAFNFGDQWLEQMNEYVEVNKQYVYRFMEENLPKLNVVISHSTYLLWIDVSKVCDDSEEFSKALQEKGRLKVSAGKDFRGDGINFIRLNVATSLDNVKEGCKRLANFINNGEIH